METRRIKYKITRNSSAPAITLALSLIAAALIGVVYWPVFYKYFTAAAAPDYQLTLMTWVYGLLIGCLVLFGFLTAALGKKTMALSAIVSLPIFAYYAIEKCGVLAALLGNNSVADVFANNPDYFSGRNLAYIIAAAAFSLVAMICFLSIVFNKGRSRTFAMFLIVLAAVARVLFALYDVRVNYQPLADKGAIDGASYVYQILLQVAAVLFFFTLTVLAIELRRHFPDEEKAAAAAAAPVAATAAPAPTPAPTTLGVAPVAPAEPPAPADAPDRAAEPAKEPEQETEPAKPAEATEAPIESVEAELVEPAAKPKRTRKKKEEAATVE